MYTMSDTQQQQVKKPNWSSCSIWNDLIDNWLNTEEGRLTKAKVQDARSVSVVYPEPQQMFRAFNITPYQEVKVVIIGQDPYHNGTADGLAFSVDFHTPSPSLKVIFEEIARSEFSSEYDHKIHDVLFKKNELSQWAKQGVLLLNTALTVEKGKAGSHSAYGWMNLAIAVLEKLNEHENSIVYMLWGKEARKLEPFIDETKHKILIAPHPQAQNYNHNISFVGCNHFRITNRHIVKFYQSKKEPIRWAII